jgi:hypothetical protein
MSDVKEVGDRITAICQETWDRLTQAMNRNEPPRLTEWPTTRPSLAALVEVAGDGAIFDGLARRVEREPVGRTQMFAVGAVQDLHARLVREVQRWAETCEWNNAGEPTDALRKAVRAAVTLISRGGELRRSCHRHALDMLGEMLWEAQRRDCGEVVLQAVCDEMLSRDMKGLMSRFDIVSIMEEMENRGLNPHDAFTKAVSRANGSWPTPPSGPILREDPGISAHEIEMVRYVMITWTQDEAPYDVTRDPLSGPAQEIRNLMTGFAQMRYVWNNQFLGRGDEPFDLVIERFAEDFPKDFALSIERWTERMRSWRENKPSHFEAEAMKMADVASRMSPIHGERIRIVLENLGVIPSEGSSLRM